MSRGVVPGRWRSALAATIDASASATSPTRYPMWCSPSPRFSIDLAIGESSRVAAVS
ncbi:MAG: hypothetical protein R2704_01485 [Microthrixaceae bacterium]